MISVYFGFDQFHLDADELKKIDSVFALPPVGEIRIEAYCDSFGSNIYNDALSMRRALAVKKYLLSKGISSVSTEGFGKRKPVNGNEDSAAQALNRRADIYFHAAQVPQADSVPHISEMEKADSVYEHEEAVFYKDSLAFNKDSSTYDIDEMEIGSTFRLQNLNFYGGRHRLLPRSEPVLVQLLNTMKAHPGLVIQIQGHICCMEGLVDGWDYDSKDNRLSLNRAKAVYDYLVSHGISRKRLSYRGFGASRKIIQDERNESEREENRRVEIMIVGK